MDKPIRGLGDQSRGRRFRLWLAIMLAVAAFAAVASPALAAPLGLEWYSALDGNAEALVGDYDGVVTGAAATTDRNGNADSALAFDGDDVVTINKAECGQFAEGTISVWVKLATTPGTRGIVSVGEAGSTSADKYFDVIQQGGYRFDVDNGNFRTESKASGSGTEWWDTEWHHVATTFVGGGGSMALYVDGELLDTDATHTSPAFIEPNKDWLIGQLRYSATDDYYLRGSVDDVSIWSVALSESDVEALADGASPLNVPEPSTVVMLLAGVAGLFWWRRRAA